MEIGGRASGALHVEHNRIDGARRIISRRGTRSVSECIFQQKGKSLRSQGSATQDGNEGHCGHYSGGVFGFHNLDSMGFC